MIEFQQLRTALNDRSRIPVYSLCAGIPQESRLSLYEFEILACLEFIFVPETHTDRIIGTAGVEKHGATALNLGSSDGQQKGPPSLPDWSCYSYSSACNCRSKVFKEHCT